MALRPTTHLTAALTLTAAFAVACSDRPPSGELVRTLPPTPEIGATPTAGLTVARPIPVSTASGAPGVRDVRDRAGVRAMKTTRRRGKVAASVVATIDRSVTYRLAEEAFLHRRFGEAASLFERVVEADPDRPMARYMHGLASWKASDLETAETAFDQVLAVTPEQVKTMQNLARVRLGQGRPEEAFELLQVALDIDRTSNVSHRLTGRALAALGRTADAAEAYGEAMRLNETDAFAMNNLALLRLDRGMPEAALPPLARAVALRGDVAQFHNNLGVVLERVGRPRTAVEAYRRALLLDPGSERAAINLERVELLAGDDARPLMDLDALADRFAQAVRTGRFEADIEPCSGGRRLDEPRHRR